ncbi:MAG: hypothetical protein GY845_15300 [Planctomycetes bacterium]|nr:hypothetical protein [Planctomycetota bacterium]
MKINNEHVLLVCVVFITSSCLSYTTKTSQKRGASFREECDELRSTETVMSDVYIKEMNKMVCGLLEDYKAIIDDKTKYLLSDLVAEWIGQETNSSDTFDIKMKKVRRRFEWLNMKVEDRISSMSLNDIIVGFISDEKARKFAGKALELATKVVKNEIDLVAAKRIAREGLGEIERYTEGKYGPLNLKDNFATHDIHCSLFDARTNFEFVISGQLCNQVSGSLYSEIKRIDKSRSEEDKILRKGCKPLIVEQGQAPYRPKE